MSLSTSYPAGDHRRHRRLVVLGTAVTLGLTAAALAACGSSPTTGSGGGTPAAGATSAAGTGAGTTVTVNETEYTISLSQSTFHPGTYTFSVANQGKFPHNIVINGPGVSSQKIPAGNPLTAGASTSGTVTLQAGSYEIYCGVPGHKAKGMDLTIQVS
jgi:uncharacterized cupredoxin-like copper-binding protein